MVVDMAVTGTVVRIDHQMNKFNCPEADMLLVCELVRGGEDLRATSEGPEGMTLGVLGARVRVVDDWGLPELGELKVGDFVYANGSWHAPGSHDMEQEMRFLEAARDWYRLESWDVGGSNGMEIRAVEITGFDVRRFIAREARWERLTDAWCYWQDPISDDAGWNAHRMTVGRLCNANLAWDQQAVEALDQEAGIGLRAEYRRSSKNLRDEKRAERQKKRETLAKVTKTPEVEAQKEAARQLARRRRSGKGLKPKGRKHAR